MAICCETCGAKLRVSIKGGEFYVRDGSTSDNINFEHAENVKLLNSSGAQIDETVELGITIYCSKDSEHRIFAITDTTIRKEIYKRIIRSAQAFVHKYTG